MNFLETDSKVFSTQLSFRKDILSNPKSSGQSDLSRT